MTTSNEAYTRSNKAPPPPPLPNKMVVLLMEARWILFAALSICLILVLVSYSKDDPGWSQSSVVPKIHNVGGKFGAWLADVLLYVFGFSTWWWCVAGLRQVWQAYRKLANRFLVSAEPEPDVTQTEILIQKFGFAMLLCGSMGIEYLRLYSMRIPLPLAPGGVLGELIGRASFNALGFTGAMLKIGV